MHLLLVLLSPYLWRPCSWNQLQCNQNLNLLLPTHSTVFIKIWKLLFLPLLVPPLLLSALEDLRCCHEVLNVLAQDLVDEGSKSTDTAPSPISTWFSDLSLRFSSFTLSTLQLRSERVFCSSSTWVMSLAFSSCSCCSLSSCSMVVLWEVAMVRVFSCTAVQVLSVSQLFTCVTVHFCNQSVQGLQLS